MIMDDSATGWVWPSDLPIFPFPVEMGLLVPGALQMSPGRILQAGMLTSLSRSHPTFHEGHAFGALSSFNLELEGAH